MTRGCHMQRVGELFEPGTHKCATQVWYVRFHILHFVTLITSFCPISVGYHLKLCIAITLYQHHCFTFFRVGINYVYYHLG